jgi:hypothetical protein
MLMFNATTSQSDAPETAKIRDASNEEPDAQRQIDEVRHCLSSLTS